MTALPSYLVIASSLLFAAAASTGDGDYQLVLPDQPAICAKSARTYEDARAAIRRGWWPVADREAETACRPAPGCFSPRSLCIIGHNC